MKRLIVLLTFLLLIPSLAFGLGEDLKKVLMMVPNETGSTGWMQYGISMLITQGGGTYEAMQYSVKQNPDSLAAFLSRARTSGKYGLVVIVGNSAEFLTDGYTASHGNGVMAKYCNMGTTASATVAPIGLPTVVCVRTTLARDVSSTAKMYTGAKAGAENWEYAGATHGADSIWCKTSEGDTLLYYMGPYKQVIDTDQTPESALLWTYDIFINDRKAIRGQGSSICMWHVHSSAYDAAQQPGAGQDSVIYYLPNFSYIYNECKDAPLKAMLVLLKRYGCINYMPVSWSIHDYAFYSTSYDAPCDSFLTWAAANHIPVTINTDPVGFSGDMYARMVSAKAAGGEYVRFGWHPTNTLRKITPADSTVSNCLRTWPEKVSRDLGTGLLSKNLKRNRARMLSLGWFNLGDWSEIIFNGGNSSGAYGYILTDTIWTALASAGTRTIVTDVTSVGGLWHPGSAGAPLTGYRGVSYPHPKYPIDLTKTGDASTVNVRLKTQTYISAGLGAASDSAYVNPARLTAMQIINAGCPQAPNFYRYNARFLLGNARATDRSSLVLSDEAENWPIILDGEARGFDFQTHQNDYRVHLTSWQNMGWNWAKHYNNNFQAYNRLAKSGSTTIGDTFKWMFLTDMPQRINERM